MIDRADIENLIDEIQNDDITLATCGDLANLYILLDHIPIERAEPTEDIQALLCDYMVTKNFIQLNRFLTKTSEVLSEVYHTCDTGEEKQEFKDFVERINSILAPTII